MADRSTAQEDFPKTLDLNDWLMFSLSDSEEIARVLALEEILATRLPQALFVKVHEISGGDPSRKCRDLAASILDVEKAAEKAGEIGSGFSFTPSSLRTFLEGTQLTFKPVIVRSLRKPPPQEILDAWRANLLEETAGEVIEIGLILLARFGRIEDADFALAFWGNPSTGVVKAAMDLLKAQNPGRLRENIASVLSSENLGIRIHAIRHLRSIDPREALRFLRPLLFQPDPFKRQLALRELLLFPFGEAESTYLQYVGAENRPLLLIMAGLGIAFNPHPDLPLKLFDIFFASKGIKRQVLQLMVNQVLETIQSSGILKEDPAEYRTRISARIQKRKQDLLVGAAIKELNNPDPDFRIAAIQRLRDFNRHPKVGEALRQLRKIETDDEVLSHLTFVEMPPEPPPSQPSEAPDALPGPAPLAIPGTTQAPAPEADPGKTHTVALVEGPPSSGKETPPSAPAKATDLPRFLEEINSGNFFDLTPELQRLLVGTVKDRKTFVEARTCIKTLFLGNPKKPVFLELLRHIETWGSQEDSSAIQPLLQHPEVPIVAAAIRVLGKIDLDAILPTLPLLMQNEDPRVKAAALEIYLTSDKEAALQYLNSMLKAKSAAVRRQALSLIPLVDFPSAEPLLIEMFERESLVTLKVEAGFVMAANLTRDCAQQLFLASRNDKGEIRREFQDLWAATIESASSILGKSEQELVGECSQEADRQAEARKAPTPDYSFEKIAPRLPPEDIPGAPGLEGARARLVFHLKEAQWMIVGFLLILSPLLWFIFSDQPSNFVSQGPNIKGKPRPYERPSTLGQAPVISGLQTVSDGGLKSDAAEVLSGGGYAEVLSQGEREREESRKEIENQYVEHFKQLAQSEKEDAVIRQLAAAQLNVDLVKAREAFSSGLLPVAKERFERVLSDPDSNAIAKVLAIQALLEIAGKNRNREEYMKWMDALTRELPNVPGMGGVKSYVDFQKNFAKVIELSEMARDEQRSGHILEALKRKGATSESDARQELKELGDVSIGLERMLQDPEE